MYGFCNFLAIIIIEYVNSPIPISPSSSPRNGNIISNPPAPNEASAVERIKVPHAAQPMPSKPLIRPPKLDEPALIDPLTLRTVLIYKPSNAKFIPNSIAIVIVVTAEKILKFVSMDPYKLLTKTIFSRIVAVDSFSTATINKRFCMSTVKLKTKKVILIALKATHGSCNDVHTTRETLGLLWLFGKFNELFNCFIWLRSINWELTTIGCH